MDTTPAGVEKENALRSAGFNDTEIDQWKSQTANDLMGAGFNTSEIGEYFGVKDPDPKPMAKVIDQNFKAAAAAQATKNESSQTPDINPNQELQPTDSAQHFIENTTKAIEAGFQMSVSGLIKRGQRPDVVLPENAPMFYRIAQQVSALAGDIPAMMAGGAIGGETGAGVGGVAGSVVPGVGTVAGAAAGGAVGTGYGAFALPAAIRSVLMQHYEKGDVKDFSDFWERTAATFIEANKQGVIGAATAGVGGAVGKVAGGLGAAAAVKTTAQLTSEVATMVTVGKAIEGKVPEPQDFIDAAVLVGGLHGAVKAAPKLRSMFSKDNAQPADIALQAKQDPLIQQQLLVEGPTINHSEEINPNPELTNKQTSASPTTPSSTEGAKASPTRTEAEQKIAAQIGEKSSEPDTTLKEKVVDAAKSSYKDFVDKLDPINEAVKKLNADPASLKADENGYILSRLANDYKAKTLFVLERGNLDFKTLAQSGESYKDIIKPFSKDPAGFDYYLAAKRAIEVEGQGKNSGFDLDAAKTVVADGAGKYEEAAQKLYEWKNKNLEYLRDSGVLSKDEFKNMTELNKSHVSFSRILEDEKGGAVSGAGSRKLGALKEFKGSDAKIESPLLTTLTNTETIFKIAERNRATTALIDEALKNPDQNILQPSEAKGKLKENQFEFWRDGQRQVWEATKDAPVGLAEAIKGLDGDIPAQGMVFKLMSGMTALKKFSITIVPDFILKNLFRDQLTMSAFSKGGGRPFLDIFPAMGDLIAKNDTYYNWLKSGGAQGTFLDVSRDYLEKNIYDLDKKTGFIDATWNVIKKPVDYLQAAGMLAEHATRLAEFKRVTQGATEGSKIFEGGFASREVTVDFSRVGAKISAMNSITAFMNMNIQGVDRTVRALKEDPVGVGTKAAVYLTVPSVLLWYANKDDQRYKDLPRWQKDLFWVIPTDHWVGEKYSGQADDMPDYMKRMKNGKVEINDGPIFRIPKPQELGLVFASIPERLLETFFTDNPNSLKDFEKTIGQLLTPNIVPDAVAPIREQWANKSLFTGNKIVSGPLEDVLPAYQYNDYTSDTAKALGKMVRAVPAAITGRTSDSIDVGISSPAIIENYVQSWTGNVGRYALQVADVALHKAGIMPDPVKPDDTLADIPFVKAFLVRSPSPGAQPIQDFYDEFGKHDKVFKTVSLLAKSGDVENLDKFLTDPQIQDMLVKIQGVKDGLRNQAQYARLVYKNPDLSSSDQRQILDGIYYMMIETARMGNDLMRSFDEVQKGEGAGK